MKTLDVYGKYDVTPVKAKNLEVWDQNGKSYLDLYGGHAVISIGHAHPAFVKAIKDQVETLAFYSNAIQIPLQETLAQKFGTVSGLTDYQLFMCNSGAEANENALKIAAIETGRSKILAFKNAFHGRTAAAVACTDNSKVQSTLSLPLKADFIPLNNEKLLEEALATGQYAAVIVEPIQGVGGLDMPTDEFLKSIAKHAKRFGTMVIADEIQSGAGRSGKFFAFQHAGITPNVISMAKGIGNGFPVGAILVHNDIAVAKGMLGTTFGGNHLACAAVISVLDTILSENLMDHAIEMEKEFRSLASTLLPNVKVKGRGLMLGLEFDFEVAGLRKALVTDHGIFTGAASNQNLLRILPPLTITKDNLTTFFTALQQEVEKTNVHA